MPCHAQNTRPPQQTACPACRPASALGSTKKAKLRTLATKTPTLREHRAMIDILRGFSNSLNHQHVLSPSILLQIQHITLCYLLQPTHQAGDTSPSSVQINLCSRWGDARPRHRTLSSLRSVRRALGSELTARDLLATTAALRHFWGLTLLLFGCRFGGWGQDLALNLMQGLTTTLVSEPRNSWDSAPCPPALACLATVYPGLLVPPAWHCRGRGRSSG